VPILRTPSILWPIYRSAKSGSDWTENVVLASRLVTPFQHVTQFYLRLPSVERTDASAHNIVDPANYALLIQLDLATIPSKLEDSTVVDFAVALFHSLGYTRRPCAIRTRKGLRLCVIDSSKNRDILLVQEDKRFVGRMLSLSRRR
jgi:hypothetical protein